MVIAMAENRTRWRGTPHWTPYQRLLRSVGAYLDMQSASQIYVLEINDGFLLRFRSREDPWRLASVRLDSAELLASDAHRQERRLERQTPEGTRAGGYEDILRAIGYHLEQVSARQVALDEVDGGYAVTYHYNAAGDMTIQKHRTTITASDAEEVLRQARGRRRPGQRVRFSPPGETEHGDLDASRVSGEAPPSELALTSTLTERQTEILVLIAQGARDREIAERLCISESTAKKHVQNVLRKLRARNRVEAVARLRGESSVPATG